MTALAELSVPGTKQVEDSQVRHIATSNCVSEIQFRMEKPVPLVPGNILFGAISDRRLYLKKPIPLDLSESEGGVIMALCTDLNEFGQGNVASDALDDFGKTICELFFHLEDQKSRLSQDLGILRNQLAEYLELRRTS